MRQDRSGQALKFKLNDNILKINLRNLKTLSKMRDRRIRKTTSLKSSKLSARSHNCPGVNSGQECVREPRALVQIQNDAKIISVTPATLALAMSPVSPPSICSFSPCEQGGSCEEHDGTFTCHCTPGHTGRYCEVEADTRDQEAGFIGQSYIRLSPPTNTVTRTSIEFEFRTFYKDGILLLWLGHTDWMSIVIIGGHVEVRYELGSGPAGLVSPAPVVLGQWHKLVFRRYHRDGMLQLDQDEPVTTRSRGRNKSLNIKDNLYIGGHPYSNSSKYLVGTDQGLQGCVRNVKMMRRDLSLQTSSTTRRQNVISCSDHGCREGYCANSGQCQVRHVSRAPTCTCGKHWRGRRCMKKRKGKKRHHKKYFNESWYENKIQEKRQRNRRKRKGKYRRF